MENLARFPLCQQKPDDIGWHHQVEEGETKARRRPLKPAISPALPALGLIHRLGSAVERLQRTTFVVAQHLPGPFGVLHEYHVSVPLRLFGPVGGVETSEHHGPAGSAQRVGELVCPVPC